MKKAKIILVLLLGIALGVLGAAGAYYLTIGEIEWQKYVEEKLIPNAVLALSSISALCVAALPIVSKIQTSVNKFNQATEDVNNAVNNDKAMISYLKEYRDEMDDMMEEFKYLRSDIKNYIEPVKKASENTERIVRIGLGNTEELVRNGYAREIAKVGKENEQIDNEQEA